MIGPTDLHPSPASNFKTFQVISYLMSEVFKLQYHTKLIIYLLFMYLFIAQRRIQQPLQQHRMR